MVKVKWDTTLHAPFTRDGTTGLNLPFVLLDGGEVELFRDLRHRHASLDVLLVGVDQHCRFAQIVVRQHSPQFLAAYTDTLPVVAINNHDDKLQMYVNKRRLQISKGLVDLQLRVALYIMPVRTYLCICVICVPTLAQRFLPSDVPHDKVYILPYHLFDI